MKILYFLVNGYETEESIKECLKLRAEGNKVLVSNGSIISGFEDSCDAIILGGDFPHVKAWAESKGIKILAEAEAESEAEAEAEAPKPRRTRAKKEPA